jgi:hypothetical protein
VVSMEDRFFADIVELERSHHMWAFLHSRTMSLQDNLLFLLLFIRSSFFARVMILLMLSLINYAVWH